MKIGIVYSSNVYSDDNKLCHSYLDAGAGGTETCIIQLAEKLAEQNNDVDVICTCDDHEEYKVKFLSIKRLEEILQRNAYDFIIIECYYKSIVKLIEKHQATNSILLFHSLNGFNIHDCFNVNSGWELSNYSTDDEMQSPLIKKFIAISESQRDEYIKYNNIPANKIAIIPNGIDAKLFESIDVDHDIDHQILWSSSYFRGAKILIDYVAPVVRKYISDFNVRMCTPIYCKDKMTHTNVVDYIGHLSKRELVEEMKLHSCWWYPSIFNETFCITSLEAALCGNELILPLINGPETTFKDFRAYVSMNTDMSSPQQFIQESAQRIADSIINYHDETRVEIRRKIQQHLLNNYSWDVVAPEFCNKAVEQ